MKIITLWQPWASFIERGWKIIETRTHDRFRNLEGETIGIHAGNIWDKDWEELAGTFLSKMQQQEIGYIKNAFDLGHEKGVILCTAKVEKVYWLADSHSKRALIDCSITQGNYRFGLFLTEIKPIDSIKVKGHQGIWNYDFKEGELVYL